MSVSYEIPSYIANGLNIVIRTKRYLEGSLDQALFVAKLGFPRTLVSRLPQNLSNVNFESTGKSKQQHSTCDQYL